jgi:ABC-type methionine transport system ATPase subunit
MRLSIDHVSVRGLLDEVSLSIDGGELFCVWSARRASRLALLGVAGKIRRPDSGSVQLRGSVVLAQPSWPQIGGARVLEQLMLPLLASRGSLGEARSRVLGFLNELDVEDWAAASLVDLEDYQLARLSLMRALISRPDVLLVDDPTHGLDPVYAEATLDLLRIARDRGAAVLVTTGTVEAMRDADGLFTIGQGVLRGDRGGQAQVIQLRSSG